MTRDSRAVRHRSLHSRNGNALACAACGKVIVPKSGSRRQKYCQDACKMKAARAKKWAKRYEIPDPLRSVENIKAISTSCKGDFGGRAFPTKDPRNLLGGYVWSDATSVDSKLIAQILKTEIGALARLFPPTARPVVSTLQPRQAAQRAGVFGGAQPIYAAHGIATFPVKLDAEGNKVPAITNYQRVGLPGSAALAERFGNASGLGFMTNARNRITVLDVDSTDERIFADAINCYGDTPVKVQTGSGKFHALYRFNGERRRIRPVGEAPIDILGIGGYVIAPPSVTASGTYRFIEGGLDDLDKLPVMRGVEPEVYAQHKPLLTSTKPSTVEGGRNKAAFDHCMRAATATRFLNLSSEGGFNRVLNAAHEFNAKCLLPPLREDEVVKIAQSAWGYEQRGDNRFGQPWVIFSIIEADHLIREDTDLYVLLSFLKTHNGPNSEFLIANGLSEIFRWSRQRLAATRHRLVKKGYVRQTKPANRYTGAALYKWADLIKGVEYLTPILN